jgi:hypothetical protein
MNQLTSANSHRIFKNKKNGNHYKILHTARDCTNSRDGEKVLVYCPVDDNSQIFVRAEAEFYQKFIELV